MILSKPINQQLFYIKKTIYYFTDLIKIFLPGDPYFCRKLWEEAEQNRDELAFFQTADWGLHPTAVHTLTSELQKAGPFVGQVFFLDKLFPVAKQKFALHVRRSKTVEKKDLHVVPSQEPLNSPSISDFFGLVYIAECRNDIFGALVSALTPRPFFLSKTFL